MSPRPVVVDASVAVKWVVEEEFATQADALAVQAQLARDWLVGPPPLPAEVANTIYQRLRRGDLTTPEADAAMADFLSIRLEILTPPDLVRQGYEFARTHQFTNVYDCLYVVLARELATELWTADRRMFASLSPVAPWIRWIGDYPL